MNNQNQNRRNPQNPQHSRNPQRQQYQQNPRNGNPQNRQHQNPQSRQQYRPDPRTMTPEQRAQWAAYQRQKRAQAEARRRAREEAERRAKEREKQLRAIERKETMKILGGRLLVFLAILAFMLVIGGALFLLFFHNTPDKTDDSGKIIYTFGGEEVRKTDLADAVIEVHGEDRIYICFNDLAKYLGMSESGSAQEMKFILTTDQNGEEITADTSAGTGNRNICRLTQL